MGTSLAMEMDSSASEVILARLVDTLAQVTGLAPDQFDLQARDALPPLVRWARSGLMQLTGPSGGTPLLPARDYAGRIAELCALVRSLARAAGGELDPEPALVAARATAAGLSRQGNVSAGGSCRILRTADSHVAVNLARPSDLELLPAWIECDAPQSWEALQQTVASRDARTLVEQGQLLGIPVAQMGEAADDTMPVRFTRMARTTGKMDARRPLLVLDFSSLWAGPLCGQFLSRLGARVVKVESTQRPDGARSGPAAFFDMLHGGQEMLAVDFRRPAELARLRGLMMKADVIIEASRPRAFAQLGFAPADIFRANPDLSWVSITGYGRDGPRNHRVGFGDDVAVAAGLVEFDPEGCPNFIGDAIADPITGLAATAGVLAALVAGGGYLVDAPMVAAASFVASAAPIADRSTDRWTEALFAPSITRPLSGAGDLGAHTEALFTELG
ncbi:MAG TPA: CoA transferase [Ramlibacter sp.]|nr:CoA transferase [Ramlibacter sp.]